MRRVALEENTIFPAIRKFLTHKTQESIIVELRRRRHDRPNRAVGSAVEKKNAS